MINMTNTRFLLIILTVVLFASCDVIKQTSSTLMSSAKPLTTEEVAQGLKSALAVGTDTAIYRLSKTNGYFLDSAVRIGLPPETSYIIDNVRKVPGLDKHIDGVILKINRAAEDAALKAAPVFKNAISTMSIEDAWSILNGSNDAATNYLKEKTYNSLVELYLPIMQESLNKPLLANISAQKSWDKMINIWNRFATSFAGKLLDMKSIDTQLDSYVTKKALDGLFSKITLQEKQIRNDADARVNDLLQRVFEKRTQIIR